MLKIKFIFVIAFLLILEVAYGQSKISFDKLEYSFKPLDSGQVYIYDFKYTNKGTTQLMINFLRLTNKTYCKIEHPKKPVDPGESSYVRIKCDLKYFPLETFGNSFMVYSNAPAPNNLKIIEFTAPVRKPDWTKLEN